MVPPLSGARAVESDGTPNPVLPVHIVNAFTEDGAGGNPAGVVLDADTLSRDQKQRIAARVGLSETVFVMSSQRAAVRLEFFTPNRQVPHCGHATVAAFHLLAERGDLACSQTSKETVEDVRKILFREGHVFMEQKRPSFSALPAGAAAKVADSVGITVEALAREPQVVSTGNPWLVVPVEDEKALTGLRPDFARIQRMSESLSTVGYYVCALSGSNEPDRLAARMFAPLFGIDEESATGSAAGPAACFFFDYELRDMRLWTVRQGHLMDSPSPSRITVYLNVAEGEIQNLLVGGEAKTMGVRELSVE